MLETKSILCISQKVHTPLPSWQRRPQIASCCWYHLAEYPHGQGWVDLLAPGVPVYLEVLVAPVPQGDRCSLPLSWYHLLEIV